MIVCEVVSKFLGTCALSRKKWLSSDIFPLMVTFVKTHFLQYKNNLFIIFQIWTGMCVQVVSSSM